MNTFQVKLPLLTLFLSFLFFIPALSAAQSKNQPIKITYSDAGLTINGLSVTQNTNIKEIKKKIGKSNSKQKFTGKAFAYVFDELGIIVFTENGQVQSIGISMETEEGGPKNPFNGIFSINNVTVSKDTNKQAISAISNTDMYCPGDRFCTVNLINTPINCLINFNNQGKISFINLSFKLIIK